MEEVWKPVRGAEEKYLVSNMGRIKSLYRRGWKKEFLSGHITKLGYVSMTINGKQIFLHRLVAEAFLEKDLIRNEVNHKNGIKTDNRVVNLEWATRSENMRHCHRVLGMKKNQNHFPKTCRKIICVETQKVYPSVSSVKHDGFNRSAVKNCLIGLTKTSGGYHWEYLEQRKINNLCYY